MADHEITVQVLVHNVTETLKTEKATFAELVMSNAILMMMALIPIVLGSFLSCNKTARSGESELIIRWKDALRYPLYMSGMLLVLYTMGNKSDRTGSKTSASREFLMKILVSYIVYVLIQSLFRVISSIIKEILPSTNLNVLIYGFCGIVGSWYLLQKHWILSNVFGLAVSIEIIEIVQLNAVSTGCVLLGSLLVCDVSWVFCTDVMLTVANSFDAPVKLVFPADILRKGIFAADNFAMVGLGDVVLPGFFIALLLRFDMSLNRNSKIYFYSSFIAYVIGFVIAGTVAHVYKYGQPALLYLVPMTVVTPILVAFMKGELSLMFAYKELKIEQAPEEVDGDNVHEDDVVEASSDDGDNNENPESKQEDIGDIQAEVNTNKEPQAKKED